VTVGGAVAQVESSGYSVCAALVDGTLRCWGSNTFGQLGRGSTTTIGDNELPSTGSAVWLGEPVAAFAEGIMSYHFCAVLESGALKCWGRNDAGQLGYGHTSNLGDGPGEVGPALPAVQVF
jgi:alpha-tubulin suppressor-like RCC1 family protein